MLTLDQAWLAGDRGRQGRADFDFAAATAAAAH